MDLKIANFTLDKILDINDVTLNDLTEFELSDTYTEDNLSILKRINFLFKNNDQEFRAALIIESETNEIVTLNYEEMK